MTRETHYSSPYSSHSASELQWNTETRRYLGRGSTVYQLACERSGAGLRDSARATEAIPSCGRAG